eukprot:CAMPEP_0194107564 /NCGR_PEP_ID=MMETSP0150-20130528/7428_1 /TAXON_ID=122233 /ORGANISM="Chaetoceros debilis, Strain MM31A-1" /LENGTH=851 /DNA_ID=CAMNT_0038796017 /DNA_START=95 /DNA_END=2650 /DNA_ORIENTATION=-
MNLSLIGLLLGVFLQSAVASAKCSAIKCGLRVPGLLEDMKVIADPPTDYEELRSFLGNVKVFLEGCGSCLQGSQLNMICDKTEDAAELLQSTIGLDKDFFNEEACRSGNFAEAIGTPAPTTNGTCGVIDKGRCAKRFPQMISDIFSVLSLPNDYEEMKDFLGTVSTFLYKCGSCMTENQLSTLCEYADDAVETLTDAVGLNSDYFDEEACKRGRFEKVVAADPSSGTTPVPAPPVTKAEPENVAIGKPTTQSSTEFGGVSSRAVDGNTSGHIKDNSITHTGRMQQNRWWQVDLLGKFEISEIILYNRSDCCSERLAGFKVSVWNKEHMVWNYLDPTPDQKPPHKTVITLPKNTIVSKVRVSIPGRDTYLSLAEVVVMGVPALESPPKNIALGKPTSQSSTGYGGASSRAIDGNRSGNYDDNSVTHTLNDDPKQWWEVNLEERFDIVEIRVYNRVDCCSERLNGFKVTIFDGDNAVWNYKLPAGEAPYESIIAVPKKLWGSRVRITIPGPEGQFLSLAEVEVYYNESEGQGHESVIDEKVCTIANQGRCAAKIPGLLRDIGSLVAPPQDFAELKDFLGNVSAYLDQCGLCLFYRQLTPLCDQANKVVEILTDNIGLEEDYFNEEACKQGPIVIDTKPAKSFVSKAQCTKRVPEIAKDIFDLIAPPTDFVELKDFLGHVSSFFQECGNSIMPSQLSMICDSADDAAEKVAETIGLDTDYFDEEACNRGGFKDAVKLDHEAVFHNPVANKCMYECDELFSVEEYVNDKNAAKRNAACFVQCLAKEKLEDAVIDLLPDPQPQSGAGKLDERASCKSVANKVLTFCLKKAYSWTKPACYATHTAARAACALIPDLM